MTFQDHLSLLAPLCKLAVSPSMPTLQQSSIYFLIFLSPQKISHVRPWAFMVLWSTTKPRQKKRSGQPQRVTSSGYSTRHLTNSFRDNLSLNNDTVTNTDQYLGSRKWLYTCRGTRCFSAEGWGKGRAAIAPGDASSHSGEGPDVPVPPHWWWLQVSERHSMSFYNGLCI